MQDRKASHQSEEPATNEKACQLSDETREMLENLTKWELPQLTKRFQERLNHLKANEYTKNDMLQKIQQMSRVYDEKNKEAIERVRKMYGY